MVEIPRERDALWDGRNIWKQLVRARDYNGLKTNVRRLALKALRKSYAEVFTEKKP